MVYASVPHYPGASQSSHYLLPFPTLIYRGDRYRLDEDGGARTRFFYTDWMEINVSIGGSLPVSSKDNDARKGMPKLDTIGELGPGMIIHFYNERNAKSFRLSLNIPIRQAISTDLHYTKARGVVFNPLLYGFYDFNKKFSIFASASAYWASKRYHQYLYDVAPKYALPQRSTYQSKGGYVVTTYSSALVCTLGDFTTFLGVSLNDAQNNANKKSPLFKQDRNWSYALGFTYYLYKIP